MDNIKIKVFKIGKQFSKVNRIINKFRKINDFKLFQTILLDFDCACNAYIIREKNNKNIYVNPVECFNSTGNMLGHPEDAGLVSTVMHELGHLLNDKFNLITEYDEMAWQKPHCHLTFQSKENTDEELADIISLYITNPFALKLICEQRYLWLKTKFQSPSPSTRHKFVTLYNDWNITNQQKFSKKYKVEVNGTKIWLDGIRI